MTKAAAFAGMLMVLTLINVSAAQNYEPIIVGDRLVIPEGTVLPRYMTETERRWLAAHPPEEPDPRAVTLPPTGPIHCVAEYEPMEGITMSWRAFNSGSGSIVAQMCREVTTTGNSKVWMDVDTAAEQSTANSTLISAGCNMSKVQFLVRDVDSVWIRDYGPRYIFEGDCRAIVDHRYNRPTRPNDDTFPAYFASVKNHAFYELGISPNQLYHGGGNFHLDARGRGYCTRLIVNENNPPVQSYSWTESQIHGIWQTFQALDTRFFDPFPTSVDLTQHIDMWMQVIADDKVVISDWPNNSGSVQDQICDNAAAYMATEGFTVYRVPAFLVSGLHYTYTNVVICNNLVLVPSYTNGTVAPSNATALATWQAAMPGKSIVQINCQQMVSAAGVMHCIVMHVPQARGNGSPTVYLKTLRGPQTLTPGAPVEIRWISDDDVGVTNVDILLSTDAGATYSTVIASATANDGSHMWTVPKICTVQGRIRVVARDASNNTGFDSSTDNLIIPAGFYADGDSNCDCAVSSGDVAAFAMALLDPAAYSLNYPSCPQANSDMNHDGLLDGADIALFVDATVP